MDTLLLLARLFLAGVFALSAITKLADRPGSRQALRDFGFPAPLATFFALLLPVFELIIALMLLSSVTAAWGALAALGLLGLFTATITLHLLRGHKPQCHCFGQLSTSPISWKTLLRNLALAALAGAGLWQGAGYSVTSTEGMIVAAAAGGVILVILQGWLVWALWRQQGRLLLRIEALETSPAPRPAPDSTRANPGLRVGTPAPEFAATDLHGATQSLLALRGRGKPVLLLFTDPGCSPCNDLLPQVSRWQKAHADTLTLALISRGSTADNIAKAAQYGLTTVLLQEHTDIAEAYRVKGTPSAVLITADGTIGSATAGGPSAIKALVTSLVQVHPHATTEGQPTHVRTPPTVPELPLGQPAPAFSLENLDGHPTQLASFQGDDTLLLFWNPGCSFCQRMLDDLKQWVAHKPNGSPNLVLLSTGTADANRAMGLTLPILLDRDFTVGRAYGIKGTPSAVMVDADGNIKSAVAVGKTAVFELTQQTAGSGSFLTSAPRTQPIAGD